MKVSNQNVPGLLGAAPQPGKPKTEAPRPAVEADQLQLSDRVRELASIREQLAGVPPVRQEKVESLRRALRAGAYKPDATAVAEGLLRRRAVDPIPE